jgi:hypothetical protein
MARRYVSTDPDEARAASRNNSRVKMAGVEIVGWGEDYIQLIPHTRAGKALLHSGMGMSVTEARLLAHTINWR